MAPPRLRPGRLGRRRHPQPLPLGRHACLHGLAEAAILAAGYAPAIGFLHSGRPLSFVYDVADLFKFETVVPVAFKVAGRVAKGQPLQGSVEARGAARVPRPSSARPGSWSA